MNNLKKIVSFVGGCFALAALIAVFDRPIESDVYAQAVGGYYTPTAVWGNGIIGMTNAFYGNITNVYRINNQGLGKGDTVFQLTMADLVSGANTNVTVGLGMSLTPVALSPTNASGGGYAGIYQFAVLPFTLNGTNPVTLCTNFGTHNTVIGGLSPAYYYVMWCSNASSTTTMNSDPITNMSVTIYNP